MRIRLASGGFGIAFGLLLAWGGLSDPDVIQRMLRLEDAYVFLLMGSAVAVGFLGVHLLRRVQWRALLTGEPITWTTSRVERRHIVGSVLFGLGWGVADACPGPIAVQVAEGVGWSLFTVAGIAIGIGLYHRRSERPDVDAARLAPAAPTIALGAALSPSAPE